MPIGAGYPDETMLAAAFGCGRRSGCPPFSPSPDLPVSHDRIGDVLRAQGNFPAALDAYKASLAIAERFAKTDPGNVDWQRALASSHGRIGTVLARHGAKCEAIAALEQGRAIIERLMQQSPDNAALRKDLALFEGRRKTIVFAMRRLKLRPPTS